MSTQSTTSLQQKVAEARELSPAKKSLNTLAEMIEKSKSQIALALPKHMTADRFARIALTLVRTNPKLLECTPQSVLAGVMMSAQLGLELGLLGHAYLVPFRNNKTGQNEVQFIIGYKGMIDLARRSGNIKNIVAHPVYEGDDFVLKYGLEEKVEHTPYFITGKKKGELRGCYCIAQFVDGGHATLFMPKDEIDQHRNRSKSSNFGPWVTDYEQMALKTVVRGIFKWLPISIEIAKQVQGTDETSKSTIEVNMEDATDNIVAPDAFVDAEIVPVASETVVTQTSKKAPAKKENMPKFDVLAKLRSVPPDVFTKARAQAGVNHSLNDLTADDADKIMIVLDDMGAFNSATKEEETL